MRGGKTPGSIDFLMCVSLFSDRNKTTMAVAEKESGRSDSLCKREQTDTLSTLNFKL